MVEQNEEMVEAWLVKLAEIDHALGIPPSAHKETLARIRELRACEEKAKLAEGYERMLAQIREALGPSDDNGTDLVQSTVARIKELRAKAEQPVGRITGCGDILFAVAKALEALGMAQGALAIAQPRDQAEGVAMSCYQAARQLCRAIAPGAHP